MCIRLLFCLCLLSVANNLSAADLFVSSRSGNDQAAGTSETTAWRSLARANQVTLAPGDRLLLERGSEFNGTLIVAAQGSSTQRIVIGAYGNGDLPRIDGAGKECCVHLQNPTYIEVRNLALINHAGHYGVQLVAENAGELREVVIDGLDISDIYQPAWQEPEDSGHGAEKYYGGIYAYVLRGNAPSWWNGLTIRNCNLHDLGTCGIAVGSQYVLHERMRRRGDQVADAVPIRGLTIERNTFRDIARDGAIIRQCDGAVLQYNDVLRTGRVSMSNGIWFWDCQKSVIQFNDGRECGVRGRADGGPFSIDYYCKDCRIENNYSQDNEGPGFMVFGNHGTGTGSVVRNNVSVNDATAEAKPGFAAVSMISTVSETIVENNVVIAGKDTRYIMGHNDWQGLPVDVLYRNNIWIGNGKARADDSVLIGGRFENNIIVDVPQLPQRLQEFAQSAEEQTQPRTIAELRAVQLRAQVGRSTVNRASR
ncbi:MAG: right-handed parallel beta-helix repeat-containing protein [Planctomycetales bacterium]|nr:right-handed parallel beta-helix repeat-containing protein [Planctomycetales bacterium]